MIDQNLNHPQAKPRLAAIVSTDWPALLCVMSLPVIWLISAQLPFVSRDADVRGAEALAIALAASLVAAALLAWRIARIHRLFAHGRRVRARISRLEVTKDRARVQLTYDLGGAQVTSWTRVYNNRRVQALKADQEVELAIDPQRPGDAILRDLYR